MKVIIPMAGTGNRFLKSGYTDPKPLINVNKKRIIEYILEMFDEDDEIIFICNKDHLINNDMKNILKNIRNDITVVEIPSHKKGPVYTVLQAGNIIEDDDEVIVCYCDNPFIWDYSEFKKYVSNSCVDGCILTHIGFHPHTLSDTKMAYLKVDKNNLLLEIKEKECYTDYPMSEHASTGAYYFRKGLFVKKYFNEIIENNIQYNGEYYVTLVYNMLVADGLKVGFYDTEYVTVFGTPQEVENFEAWSTILKGSQVKNTDDLIACYNYWKSYHAHSSNIKRKEK